ncbi:hypothetical protein [Mesorhizobium sp. M4B.F.Ca.ET.049.02.1.2]|uniref:hypothetical protein n=1 Tax=Mesorhizobium sp. M4B.F.Ca.ET.049.02.1.2 TaxID=2496752 RepID=UPI001FDFEF3F|nr:hypothetical protein [Mesorhizobium sp. M4B.F.Ca.ET.049.02.1.2]
MAIEDGKYPGELASPQQIHELAEEYRKAAHQLLPLGRAGKPLTRAPFRLSAIHAIELYLTALLLHRTHTGTAAESVGARENLQLYDCRAWEVQAAC